jgi:hypothetical protein
MQLLPEFGNVRLPLPDFGKHVWPDPGHFGQIRPDQWQDQVRSDRLLNMAGFRRNSLEEGDLHGIFIKFTPFSSFFPLAKQFSFSLP